MNWFVFRIFPFSKSCNFHLLPSPWDSLIWEFVLEQMVLVLQATSGNFFIFFQNFQNFTYNFFLFFSRIVQVQPCKCNVFVFITNWAMRSKSHSKEKEPVFSASTRFLKDNHTTEFQILCRIWGGKRHF